MQCLFSRILEKVSELESNVDYMKYVGFPTDYLNFIPISYTGEPYV